MIPKFKIRSILRFKFMVCVFMFYGFGLFQIFAQSRPNILFICTDEQHPAISGYRGNSVIKTPNLDALAADGMHFTRAYVASPVCAPSRAAYMYGKYINDLKYWYNGQAWPKDEVTWATRVTQSGYQTAHYGKMDSPGLYGKLGFSEEWNSAERPERKVIGPDTRFNPERGRLAKGHLRVNTFDIDTYNIDPFTAGPQKYGQYAVDRPSINHALRFLDNRDSDKKPWMMHVGLLMPHWPITLPKKYYDMYANVDIPMPHDAKFPNKDIHPALQHFQKWDGLDVPPNQEDLKNALRGYYGMITCLDDMLGELITELKKKGMYENTYIVFTSDHGDNLGEHGLIGNKHTPMEASVSVPLIISGPGIKQGVKNEMPVSLVDMYPTIMDMARIQFNDPNMSGKNLMPVLEGKEEATDRTVFSEWHGVGFPAAWYMLVNKQYKYIYYERDRPSLFDIENDPKELNDLALNPEYANKIKEFETELKNRIDPIKVAKMARKHQHLINDEGQELIFGEAPFQKSK